MHFPRHFFVGTVEMTLWVKSSYYTVIFISLFLSQVQAFMMATAQAKFNSLSLHAISREAIDDTTFQQILSSEQTKFIPILNGKNFARPVSGSDMYEPVFLSNRDIDIAATSSDSTETSFYYLGTHTATNTDVKVQYVVANISSLSSTGTLQHSEIKCDVLRMFADQLDPISQSMLTHARGLAVWHDSCKFCSKCGSKTVLYRQGGGRKCSNSACKMSHYPRIEPAVIMAITSKCNNHLLLGRKKEWPKGRFSTLAGFLEVGETLEDAVIRETWEESGILVDRTRISYFQSQPWPFPSSFMLGFIGSALEPGLPEIVIDRDEMEDVQWFSREQILSALSSVESSAVSWEPNAVSSIPLHFPGKYSLARKLIEKWASSN